MQSDTPVRSMNALLFGPGNVLFIGDSLGASVFAFELCAARRHLCSKAYHLLDLDQAIGDLLGVPRSEIVVKDMALHPVTHDAYVAVHRGRSADAIPVLIRVESNGALEPMELARLPHTRVALPRPVEPGLELDNEMHARSATITALAYADGDLFVSGVSNAEFATTLHRIPYPFAGGSATSSIEIYHAGHDQIETSAPIQAMTVLTLGGELCVLAAYTCTPLVTLPVKALRAGAHVRGKTIAELGYGNRPLGVLTFQSKGEDGAVQNVVLITHKNRGPMLFTVEALATQSAAQGLSRPSERAVVAPPFQSVPLGGVFHVADQGDDYLVAMRRDMETGTLGLFSYRKGLYFRYSKHLSEYVLPGYEYSSLKLKASHKVLLKEEGF